MPTHVTLDEHRIARVNGRPMFPIAARHMPQGATPALLQQVGFNALRWTPFGMDAYERESFEVPGDLAGLMYYTYVYNRGDLSDDVERRRRELTAVVEAVRGDDRMLCYEQRNEPAFSPRDHAKPQGSPQGMTAGSAIIRKLDPHHPIRVGHMVSNLVSTLRRYNPAVDIVGCNPYVVIPPGMRPHVGFRADGKMAHCPDQTLSAVGVYTSKMMRVSQDIPGGAVWMQVQGSANENWFSPQHTPEYAAQGMYVHHLLYPTRWQMRFMAFNAIIRGATGLEWMLVRLPTQSAAWLDVTRVIGELSELHDVLASPPWPGRLGVEYTELGFSDFDGVETLVKLRDGRPWVLAANTQFDPMIATFSGLPQGVGDRLRVVGENREVAVKDGSFTDRFAPYEVHVYASA